MIVVAIALWLVELVAGCHCSTWTVTAGGLRCAVEVQRCELVTGWHDVAPFTPTCSVHCD